MRQPTAAEGKRAYFWPLGKREEPSFLTVTSKRYFSMKLYFKRENTD